MPIVAGLFYSFDITISPIWSSIAMSLSSILVVGFSHLLTLFTYDESEKETKISWSGLKEVILFAMKV
jgi:hypothetical protein